MAQDYSQDSLVEQPAIKIFSELGWQTVSALEEVFGVGGTLGRETKAEAVLVARLRAALGRLNPSLPPEAISGVIDHVTRDLLPPRLLSGQVELAPLNGKDAEE